MTPMLFDLENNTLQNTTSNVRTGIQFSQRYLNETQGVKQWLSSRFCDE